MIGPVLLALLVSAALAVTWAPLTGTVRPAQAQQSLIDSDPAVVKALADLADAQSAAHEAAAKLEQFTEQKAAVEAQIADDQSRVAELDQERATLASWRDALLAKVRERAAVLYRNGGDGTGVAEILSGSALDGVRRKELGDIAARNDRATMTKLDDARNNLAVTQDSLRKDQADLETQQASLESLVGQLQQQQAAVDQRVAAANAALARAREIGALHAAGEPIIGPATLTVDQMMAWYDAQGYRPRLAPGVTVADLAQIYLQEGGDEGVRGDFAFAQAIVETGGFASSPDNNYSGLGWCDSCSRGTVFPTPRDGIRAQIQLLLNYADIDSRAANLHHPPSPYWWDPNPVVAAHYFDTYFAKGWAPTWSQMGHGNWATDPKYAGKVINVYHQMVAYTQSH